MVYVKLTSIAVTLTTDGWKMPNRAMEFVFLYACENLKILIYRECCFSLSLSHSLQISSKMSRKRFSFIENAASLSLSLQISSKIIMKNLNFHLILCAHQSLFLIKKSPELFKKMTAMFWYTLI